MKKTISFSLFICTMLFLHSCSSQCYEVYETKEIIYNIEGLPLDATTKEGKVVSKKDIDSNKNYRAHFFNDHYSYSKNYRGTEVINLKTQRRFKKSNRDGEKFKEARSYQEISDITPQATGNIKTINGIECKEYVIQNEFKINLLYYTTEAYPFTHLINFPFTFPNHLVMIQGYSGDKEVYEKIYGIKEVDFPSEFKKAIAEVKKLE